MNTSPILLGSTLAIHRGAIDQTTITTQPPPDVMQRVRGALESMGIEVHVESEYKYRCIRPGRRSSPSTVDKDEDKDEDSSIDSDDIDQGRTDATPEEEPTTPKAVASPLPSQTSTETEIAYGPRPSDPSDEVRFSVELTRLSGLADTYSLDIRRLKGGLRGYKFVYDQLRELANLQR
ncbi:hypothetical protein Hypma_001009 [Hypsizygus marmoreus]|uniref:non-specific serine/threonine protein kinase n=1 Tax=Hypsizygus marmoreus TaxID=39966 RepID=A0A369J6I3_HYPMA|nr:hypothetical protein Hypma_001009 [Hypsizygus marmoreus]